MSFVCPHGRECVHECPDPRDTRIAELEAAMLRACADLVRLVAPDHRPGDMVQRADVVEIAMQLKAAMDERTAG